MDSLSLSDLLKGTDSTFEGHDKVLNGGPVCIAGRKERRLALHMAVCQRNEIARTEEDFDLSIKNVLN
jgi:hypothetical protein